jgi:hypothetical protein
MKKKKAKAKAKKRHSAVARHADYVAQQEIIDAPFGKAFKTGGHKTGKQDISRKRVKQGLKSSY